MKKETLNKEETQAVKELIEKIPDEELKIAAGKLDTRTQQILKGIGTTALTALAIWLATNKLKSDIKGSDKDIKTKKGDSSTKVTSGYKNDSFDNDNTKFDKVSTGGSGFDWDAWNNDNTKFDDPNFGEPSAPPIPEDELWKYGY